MSRGATIIIAVLLAGFSACQGQISPPVLSGQVPTNLIPAAARLQSPVAFFRQMLAMSPADRRNAITNRTPEAQARILEKIHEYLLLQPDERELKLRATELRWHLTQMMKLDPKGQESRLAQLPEELRDLLKTRLLHWNLLPPPVQRELLTNDQALRYLASVNPANSAVPDPAQQKIASRFNQFFELTPREKKKTLATLSDAERASMEKTLQTFEKLPPAQRARCVRNYARFAGMDAVTRAEFLRNAEAWSKLTPNERQAWRDLVSHVPIQPPMPPPAIPQAIYPGKPQKPGARGVATN